MRAVIIRLAEDNKQTLGEFILYDGIERVFSCKTLELPFVMNAPFISCIPKGIYEVIPRNSLKYKNHYHIIGVPDRDFILIHVGNFNHQTEGCILVGKNYAYINDDDYFDITHSKATMTKLLSKAPDGFILEII
tara:strand:+ start:15302 stop:15703 length:402 start_codon:yes stop_codon:yes gene_type:complete